MPRHNARRSSRRSPGRFVKSSYGRRLRAESLEDRRMLATITVTSPLDNTFLDSQVTLREAIQAANLDISVNGSEAGSGADTIVFAPSLAGQTIELGGLELELTEALTIDATPLAGGVTIDGQQNSRLFHITAETGDFTFAGLTLTGGRTTVDNADFSETTHNGGAIRSVTSGTLTLDRSVLVGNSTAGGYADGGALFSENSDVIISGSALSENSAVARGGAVSARSGSVTVTGSTLSGNTAGQGGGGVHSLVGSIAITSSTLSGNASSFGGGGGVYAGIGTSVTVTNSTLSQNSSNASGGGVRTLNGEVTLTGSTVSGNSTNSRGGGVSAATGSVTLTGSTVSNNSSSGNGGGVYAGGSITLSSSTVYGNRTTRPSSEGGGLFLDTSFIGEQLLVIQNSIVAGNTVPASGSHPDLSPDPQSSLDVEFSLIGDADGLAIGGLGNQIGDSTAGGVLDPLLAPLADNGGLTRTHALLPGSPAIDGGSPLFDLATMPHDQRGAPFNRAFGARVDIGAYERQTVAGLSLIVDEASDLNDGDISPGNLSLREAIGLANGSLGPDTITFDGPFNLPQTLALADQLPAISDRLTINGPGQALLTLDAGHGEDGQFATGDGFRHFDLDDGLASRTSVTLSGLTLTGGDVPFVPGDPVRDGLGGAIRSRENLNLSDVTIFANAATEGGGVSSRVGGLEVTRSTLINNRTTASGGGIHHDGAGLTVTASTISGNQTVGDFAPGGGIYSRQPLEISQSTISGNTTAGDTSSGGGVFASQGFDITQSTIVLNQTLGPRSPGGGLYQSARQSSSLSGTILSANRADSGNDDDFAAGAGQFNLVANFNLIGTSVNPTNSANNVVSNAPGLGALANNGGPTPTHLPQRSSLAVDAGNPAATSGSDQRGAPYRRVVDGDFNTSVRIDIGAVEFQPDPQLAGDYNNDNRVDTADYAVWRSFLGRSGLGIPADGNRDGVVDNDDFTLWRQNFGATAPPAVSLVTAQAASVAESTETLDTAFALLAPPAVSQAAPQSSSTGPAAETPARDESLLLFALEQPAPAEGATNNGEATPREESDRDPNGADSLQTPLTAPLS